MKKSSLFRIFLFLTHILLNSVLGGHIASASVLMLGQNTDIEKMAAYSKSHPEDIGIIDWLKKNILTKSNSKQIFNLFSEAQKSFIEDDTHIAIEKYNKILAYQFNADWDSNTKEIFVLTKLRLAQLEPDLELNHIRSAYLFHPDYHIPEDLFAPQIIEKWQKQNINSNPTVLNLYEWRDYDLIIINGEEKVLSSNNYQIKIPSGHHRFTFISHKFMPETYIINAENLTTLKAKKVPLVSGDCLESKITKHSALKGLLEHPIKVIYPNCVFDQNQKRNDTQLSIDELKAPLDISKAESMSWHTEGQKPKDSIFEKKGFWWSVLGASALYLIIQANNSNEKEPTAKNGW